MKQAQIKSLAKQALNYLESLKAPLPEETEVEFYEQNRKDYQALLTLNEMGLGATEKELKKLSILRKPLTIIKDMVDMDKKRDDISESPWFSKHWECVNRRTGEYKFTKRAQSRLDSLADKIINANESLVLALKLHKQGRDEFSKLCESIGTYWECWIDEEDMEVLGWQY